MQVHIKKYFISEFWPNYVPIQKSRENILLNHLSPDKKSGNTILENDMSSTVLLILQNTQLSFTVNKTPVRHTLQPLCNLSAGDNFLWSQRSQKGRRSVPARLQRSRRLVGDLAATKSVAVRFLNMHRFKLCQNYMMFLLVLYPPPYFEAEYCLFCGRRRVAVARYRMICLVHAQKPGCDWFGCRQVPAKSPTNPRAVAD